MKKNPFTFSHFVASNNKNHTLFVSHSPIVTATFHRHVRHPSLRRRTSNANNITMVISQPTLLLSTDLDYIIFMQWLNYAAEFEQNAVFASSFHWCSISWGDSSVFSVYELQATKNCYTLSREDWLFKPFQH